MNIIPVIDLLNGVVVHAKQGQRQHYQAIASQLTHSSKPLDIVSALLDLYPFKSLYIADLNSIQKDQLQYNHIKEISNIQTQFPMLKLMVDCGIDCPEALDTWKDLTFKHVLGTENFPDITAYALTTHALSKQNKPFLLSLDYMPDGFKGDERILAQAEQWPNEVIGMTLAKVGSNNGPNINLLKTLMHKNDKVNMIAAGGIRHLNDLQQLKQAKISGALIATALHQKQITATDLQQLKQ